MNEKELRKRIIRLAHSKPHLREHLMPLVTAAPKEAAKYPWDQCIKDQMAEYGDRETAEKVCGKIYWTHGPGAKRAAAMVGINLEDYRRTVKLAYDNPDMADQLIPMLIDTEKQVKQAQDRNIPDRVEELADSIRAKQPGVSDEYAYRVAWSIYCKYSEPGSPHCSRPPSGYLTEQG